MARGQDPTPFYIRTQDGDTFYVDTLEEALECFVDPEEGYRLTLQDGEHTVVIRRAEDSFEKDVLHQTWYEAKVVVRKTK